MQRVLKSDKTVYELFVYEADIYIVPPATCYNVTKPDLTKCRINALL